MIYRHLTDPLLAALADTPVVLLHGARQTGKSTLARWIADERHPAAYYTLDDAAVFAAASHDPDGFLRAISGSVVIDEIQLAPDLLRAIKIEVDRDRTPGRFLLTGSANVLMVPKLAESLAGRMEILTLWPFSLGELLGVRERFPDRVFDEEDLSKLPVLPIGWEDLVQKAVAGGYPEAVRRTDPSRRRAWFASYVTTILHRDVRLLSDIAGLAELPRLLAMLATQCGGLLNMAALARDIGFSQPTVKKYLALLQATHLVHLLPAWAGSRRKRLIKAPRVFLNDTGLLAYLLGIDTRHARGLGTELGRLLEAFVYQELRKQIGWSRCAPRLYYYRTATGLEVDFVLEHSDGRIVGIEVKATATLRSRDLRGLQDLADTAGERFQAGVLLYQGSSIVPYGNRIWALPFGALFGG